MKIFHYNPYSGEYTHTTNAQENPREKGTYFEQTNSTFDVPPKLNSKEAAKRDIQNNQWLIVEDFRGKVWDTQTKVQSELTQIGPLPEGLTNVEPGEFDKWDGAKWVLETSAQLKDAQIKSTISIRDFATQCREKIAGHPDHLQTAAWSEKARRAEKVIASTATNEELQTLQTEASYRGKDETPKQLAQKQLTKATRFANATAIIDGMTSAAIAQIKSASDVAQIDELLTTLKAKGEQTLAGLLE